MRRIAVLVCLLAAGCTASSATPATQVERQNLATATVVDPGTVDIEQTTGVVADVVTVAPGGTSGWHTHSAPELVLVKSGELTFYRSDRPGCGARTFGEGDAFVGPPGGVAQMATNAGKVPTELVVTFFGIPEGGHVREDAPVPTGCPEM
jgi:quercetin dioxygenase-like cupin family protein